MKRKYGLRGISWNFFASNHGKIVCDTRAANVKHCLKHLGRLFLTSVISRQARRIEGPEEIVEQLNLHMKNGNSVAFGHFKPLEPIVKVGLSFIWQIDAGVIKKWHYFEYMEENPEKEGDGILKKGSKITITCRTHSTSRDAADTGELTLAILRDFNITALSGSDFDSVVNEKAKSKRVATSTAKRNQEILHLQRPGALVRVRYLRGKNHAWYWGTVVKPVHLLDEDTGEEVLHLEIKWIDYPNIGQIDTHPINSDVRLVTNETTFNERVEKGKKRQEQALEQAARKRQQKSSKKKNAKRQKQSPPMKPKTPTVRSRRGRRVKRKTLS